MTAVLLNIIRHIKAAGALAMPAAVVLALAVVLTGCAFDRGGESPVTGEDFVLDTVCRVSVYDMKDMSAGSADKIIKGVFDECRRYDNLLSKTIEVSDVYRINHAGGKPVKVSADAADVIKEGLRFGKISDGGFDITIGSVTELWEFHEGEEGYGAPPAESDVAEALRHVDYRKVGVDGRTVTMKDPEARIDLGGIAKGWISDKLAEYMEKRGVTSAVIDLGGNIVCIGEKPGGRDFKIGIKAPLLSAGSTEDEEDSENSETEVSKEDNTGSVNTETKDAGTGIAASEKIRNGVVITSGTYERCFEYRGKRYHHIIDPKTGYPAETDTASATVIAKKGQGASADAIATVLVISGSKSPLLEKLKEKYGPFKAVIIDNEGILNTIEP